MQTRTLRANTLKLALILDPSNPTIERQDQGWCVWSGNGEMLASALKIQDERAALERMLGVLRNKILKKMQREFALLLRACGGSTLRGSQDFQSLHNQLTWVSEDR